MELARIRPETGKQDLKAACLAEMDRGGLSRTAGARLIGKSASTISRWLNDAYAGDVAGVEAAVARWLETRAEAARSTLAAAGLDRHAQTVASTEIETALAFAQADAGVALIVGPPGRSKTWTVQRHCRARAGAAYFRATRAMTTMAGLLARLAEAAGAGAGHGSALAAESAIVDALRERGALLGIDEAHHLRAAQLDELRCIRDLAGCGLALVGDESITMTLARCPQIVGRIGMRVDLARIDAGDVAAIAAGPLGRAPTRTEMKALLDIARGPGGLHALRGVLGNAWALARHDEREAVAPEDVAIAAEAAA